MNSLCSTNVNFLILSLKSKLTLESTYANISATTYICKQSAVTFEVVILWLRNQHYHAYDVIGIKVMHRDLP